MPVAPALAAVGGFLGSTAGVATVAGATGLASAAIGASAAKSAAQTQASAAQQATNVQQQMYNTTRSDLSPYNAFGQSFLPGLQKLLGTTTTSGGTNSIVAGAPNWDAYIAANPDVAAWIQAGHGDPSLTTQTPEQAAAYQYGNTGKTEGRALPTYSAADASAATSGADMQTALENIPGYKFARDQGVQQVTRALGSTGQTGAQAKGIARFVTGLADQNYNQYVQNYLNAATLGENAAAQTGSIGANYAGGISNTIVGQGTAQAAGTVGAANAISGGLGSATSGLLLNKILGSGTAGSGAGQYGSASLSYPGGYVPD